jgi:hypothetical protein
VRRFQRPGLRFLACDSGDDNLTDRVVRTPAPCAHNAIATSLQQGTIMLIEQSPGDAGSMRLEAVYADQTRTPPLTPYIGVRSLGHLEVGLDDSQMR